MYQPRCSSHSASIRCVRRYASSLRGGLLDRRTGAADDFPRARPCILLIRRNGSSRSSPFFYAQLVLRERSRRKRISNSWLLVGSIHALFTTRYGQLLLFKLALFAILVIFGARNRFLIREKPFKAPADRNVLSQ